MVTRDLKSNQGEKLRENMREKKRKKERNTR